MQLIGVENPAPSLCSVNISGCSPSVRMTITLPFGLTTQSMSGGCIPCWTHCLTHCLRTSRMPSDNSSIFLCYIASALANILSEHVLSVGCSRPTKELSRLRKRKRAPHDFGEHCFDLLSEQSDDRQHDDRRDDRAET